MVMASEECMESREPGLLKAKEEQSLPEVMNGDSYMYLHTDDNIVLPSSLAFSIICTIKIKHPMFQ